MNPEIVGRIQAAIATADRLSRASDALRKEAGPREIDPIWPIIDAFAYHYIDPRDEERRKEHGPFAPMLELRDGVYPRRLRDVPDEVLEIWAQYAQELSHPVARGRLHDLLWERRRRPRPDEHARAAIDAYLDLATLLEWQTHERAEGLDRALTLARGVNDEDRRIRVTTRIVDTVTDWLRPEHLQPPGLTLILFGTLVRLPRELRPSEAVGLLETAHVRYADNPWIRGNISDLQARALHDEPERARAVRRAQIDMWHTLAAQQESPFKRMHFLQIALELARIHGHSDLLEEFRRELQEIRIEEEKEFKAFSVRIEISVERTNAIVDGLLEPEDWRECLLLFGGFGPPSGSLPENEASVARQLAEHPLATLFPAVRFSEAGIPIRTAADPEDHQSAALVEHELWGINAFRGVTGRRFLEEFRTRKGIPDYADLAAFFATDLVGADRAGRIARAFELFWDGQMDEAAHVIVPRLEAVLRDLCRMSGYSVVLEPAGDRSGALLTLGAVVEKLRDAIAVDVWPSWWRYLRTTLTDPTGLNLRNRISHGMIEKVEAPDVVVLLHIACFLRLLEARDRTETKIVTPPPDCP